MLDRADLIVRYFDYLVSDYSFHIAAKEFDPNTMGNAYVIFKSSKIGIEIVIDRNQVLISMGDLLDPRREWLEFSNVLRYFAPSIEKAYDFPEPEARGAWNEDVWNKVVETQLDRLAVILRQNCEPLLKGDLSMKQEIKKIQEIRRAELLANLKKGTASQRKNDG